MTANDYYNGVLARTGPRLFRDKAITRHATFHGGGEALKNVIVGAGFCNHLICAFTMACREESACVYGLCMLVCVMYGVCVCACVRARARVCVQVSERCVCV